MIKVRSVVVRAQRGRESAVWSESAVCMVMRAQRGRKKALPARSASEKRQRKAPAKSASDQRQRVHRESTQRGFSRLVSAGRGFLGSAVEKICVRHLSRRGVALQDGVVSCHRSA